VIASARSDDSAASVPTCRSCWSRAATSSDTRHVLRYEVRDLPDEQAASSPTVSELSLGGLIKHVSRTETAWIQRAVAMG